MGRVLFQICDVCDNFVKGYPAATTRTLWQRNGINFRLARRETEFDDDVDVAGMGRIDRRFPRSLSEMLIAALPCIIPFVDVKCSMVAWHT